MNHNRLFAKTFLGACCAMTFSATAQPQLPLPQSSPAAALSQTIGITEVMVSYHRPAVKGRPVWGALVPYGEVWRAGANENTTVMFSKGVKVGGKDVLAGTYGLHMIPTRAEWTIILSKNAASWGSYFYKEAEDALRLTVAPQPGEFCESLQFEFSDLSDSSAVLSLCWEKMRVPIPIAVDTRSQVLTCARDEYLRGMAGFSWQGFNQAAQYALRNGGDLNEALLWANQSAGIAQNFTNLRTRAAVLDALGRGGEAVPLYARAMKVATEAEINMLGYTLMAQSKMKEAIEMFEKNARDYPDSWNVYDSLAEGLEKGGDVKGAIQNYENALTRVTDDANKKRIVAAIKKLRGN
jgi:tetratricopeptide (TPR) repeat protein